jgi:hypothetical protein
MHRKDEDALAVQFDAALLFRSAALDGPTVS